MFPCPPVDRWRRFESVMKECIRELGHELSELDFDNSLPPDPPGMDFRIYAHKTRVEAPMADLYHKEMHMKGLFTLDAQGWGADHSSSRTAPELEDIDAREAERFCEEIRGEFLRTGLSKHNQPAMKPVDSGLKPYVFVPLQLSTDDTIMNHSRLSVVEFIHLFADWAAATGNRVVFKLHPGSPMPETETAVRERAREQYVALVNGNVHSLIAESQGVAVINSGTGFETLIHGKPVATFGACDYQWATFRAAPDDLDGMLRWMRSFAEADRLRGCRFIYHYYHRHAYPVLPEVSPATRDRLRGYLREVM
ncbi:MAG TPA: hypothetical protein VGL72_25335 [Bryobacteraceae bacterium]|jgi:hypothetical protein